MTIEVYQITKIKLMVRARIDARVIFENGN